MDYSLKEAAALLGIPPSTLHTWSEHFDALLSDSARRASARGGSTASGRYTEADIAILQRAKRLIWSGHSYDQTLNKLAGDRPSERPDSQVDRRPRTGASFDDTTHPRTVVQAVDKQPMLKQDERTATLDRAQRAQQSQINQLREYMLRLQAENEALREQRVLWKERIPWLLSYRTAMIVALCGSAILIALGIVWLSNPRALVNDSAAKVALTASPVSAVVNSTANAPLNATLRPQLTPRTALAQTPANPSTQQASPVAASPHPLPTTAPIPTTAPTAVAVVPITDSASASDILLQIAQAEAALRTGQLEATITYGSGQRSAARVRFDLGDEQRVPRFQITTTYEGSAGAQTFARTTIGDQSWERQQDGRWTVIPARESALKQLQVFLPRSDSISDFNRVIVKSAAVEGTYALRWYDAARDADVTLLVDTAGIPQQLRRVSRVNSLVLTVTYSGWNTAVEITPPD
jgi:DNA-binding transcriptional MerR regulator